MRSSSCYFLNFRMVFNLNIENEIIDIDFELSLLHKILDVYIESAIKYDIPDSRIHTVPHSIRYPPLRISIYQIRNTYSSSRFIYFVPYNNKGSDNSVRY